MLDADVELVMYGRLASGSIGGKSPAANPVNVDRFSLPDRPGGSRWDPSTAPAVA